MAKTKISEFSTTAGNNTDINSINIAEGCAPSGINDAIRELMRQLKEFQTGGAGDSVNSGGDFSVATNKFTVASASGNTAVAGTLAVTGVATLTAQPILSSLTASKAVFTDASKGLVSNDVTGTGNVVMSNSPTLVTPALGTPASGVVTNLTGTASININGTVGATTPSTGAFTTLSSTGNTTLGDASGDTITVNGTTTFVNANPTLSAGTANGVLYLNGSKVATSGSALTFDGTNLAVGTSTASTGIRLVATPVSSANYFNNTIASFETNTSDGLAIYRPAATTIGFKVNSSREMVFGIGDQTPSEIMRLTSTGLGIGTSSPSYKLDTQIALTGTAAGDNTAGYFGSLASGRDVNIGFGDSVNASARIGYLSGALYMYTNGAERLRLDLSGNLGLGVTPSAWTTYTAQQIRNASVYGWSGGNSFAALAANTWYGGSPAGYRYISTDFATEYYQYQGAHIWRTAASGTAGNAIAFTQAMTLDASGRLLVGLTSGPTTVTVATPSTNSNLGVYSNSQITLSNPTTVGAYSQIAFGYNSGTSISNAAAAIGFVSTSADTWGKGDLVFATRSVTTDTAPTERARIDSSGNLLVGKTATGVGTAGFGAKDYIEVTRDGNPVAYFTRLNSDGDAVQFRRSSGAAVGSISVTTTATAYNTSSDYRLKDNQQPLTGSGAFIDALKPKTWNWKADGSRGVGFIAHEVQEVSPGSVVGEKDGEQMQAMEYGSAEFIANIIAELQSLRARVAQLESN